MDIRVGSAPEVGAPADPTTAQTGTLEARLLGVRAPRQTREGRQPKSGERRRGAAPRDPVNARVLILLIADGGRLPAGLESGNYRVFLRFARR